MSKPAFSPCLGFTVCVKIVLLPSAHGCHHDLVRKQARDYVGSKKKLQEPLAVAPCNVLDRDCSFSRDPQGKSLRIKPPGLEATEISTWLILKAEGSLRLAGASLCFPAVMGKELRLSKMKHTAVAQQLLVAIIQTTHLE